MEYQVLAMYDRNILRTSDLKWTKLFQGGAQWAGGLDQAARGGGGGGRHRDPWREGGGVAQSLRHQEK